MRFVAYALIAGLGLGWLIHGWYTDAGQVHAVQHQERVVAKQNQRTVTRTTAAATHIQAIGAGVQQLHQRIAALPTGDLHALPACPDPFADPFRLLYDAGSAAEPAR